MSKNVIRQPNYGNPADNRAAIIRKIKDGYDSGYLLSAFTVVINTSPVNNSLPFTIAFIAEYDSHVEIYDQHEMTLFNRKSEKQFIAVIRAITQLGLGDRILFSVQKYSKQVFNVSPDATYQVIKASDTKLLIPHWREFVDGLVCRTPMLVKQTKLDWDYITTLYRSCVNSVKIIDENRLFYIVENECQYHSLIVGRCIDLTYVLMFKAKKMGLICYMDETLARDILNKMSDKMLILKISGGLSPRFEYSIAQQLISLNQINRFRVIDGKQASVLIEL